MYCHGNCRERAKHILKCIASDTNRKDDNNEALSEKLLRQIKKDALLIYDKPIGCLYGIRPFLTIETFTLTNSPSFH